MSAKSEGRGNEYPNEGDLGPPVETADQHPRPTSEEIDKRVAHYKLRGSQNERLYQEIVEELYHFATDQKRNEPSLEEIRENHFKGWEKEDFYDLLKRLGETEIITKINEDENEKKQYLIQEINRMRKLIPTSTIELTQITEALERKRQKHERDAQLFKEIKDFKEEALQIIDEKVSLFEKDTRLIRLEESLQKLLQKFTQETISSVSASQETLPTPEVIDMSEKRVKELINELEKTDSQLRELSERKKMNRREMGRFNNRLEPLVYREREHLDLIERILREAKPGLFKKDTRADRIRTILTQMT